VEGLLDYFPREPTDDPLGFEIIFEGFPAELKCELKALNDALSLYVAGCIYCQPFLQLVVGVVEIFKSLLPAYTLKWIYHNPVMSNNSFRFMNSVRPVPPGNLLDNCFLYLIYFALRSRH
jgi:hypothetical protein